MKNGLVSAALLIALSLNLISCDQSPGTDHSTDTEEALPMNETYWQLPDDASFSVNITSLPIKAGSANILVSVGPGDWSEEPFEGNVSIRVGKDSDWERMSHRGINNTMAEYEADVELVSGKVNIQFKLSSAKYDGVIELKDWFITVP